MDQNQAIAAFIEEKKEEMLALWKELVNLESYVGEADHVTAVLRRVQQELEAEGFDCRLVEVGGGWAGTLVGTLGADRPGKPILFSGHLDTVFPAGSWGPAPFRIEDGKAYGPGALDMKGGVVIALYVAKALNHIGYRQTPIKVIFSGNEEKGHVGSTGDQVFLEEARGCQFAFNMETGLHTGELCVGRKGHLGCHVEVTGIESHAGNDFESGRSAIEEAAHKILAIQALTDLEEGTTVNVGVIQGGTVPNAVPGSCRFEVDIRVAKEEGRSRIKRMLPPIVEHCTVPGTSATYAFDGDSPIYETTEPTVSWPSRTPSTSSAPCTTWAARLCSRKAASCRTVRPTCCTRPPTCWARSSSWVFSRPWSGAFSPTSSGPGTAARAWKAS